MHSISNHFSEIGVRKASSIGPGCMKSIRLLWFGLVWCGMIRCPFFSICVQMISLSFLDMYALVVPTYFFTTTIIIMIFNGNKWRVLAIIFHGLLCSLCLSPRLSIYFTWDGGQRIELKH